MRSLRILLLLTLAACATRPPHLPDAGASIPIQLLDGRLILVAVSVNESRPLSFILDTGAASGTFLNASRLTVAFQNVLPIKATDRRIISD